MRELVLASSEHRAGRAYISSPVRKLSKKNETEEIV